MWCLIEVSAALIGCCLPVLRPLLADTWVSRLLCKMGDYMCPAYFSTTSSSDRELEEGMAHQSIGGTSFPAASKRRSTRKDSKMSNTIDTYEVDDVKELTEPSRVFMSPSKETDFLKDIDVDGR